VEPRTLTYVQLSAYHVRRGMTLTVLPAPVPPLESDALDNADTTDDGTDDVLTHRRIATTSAYVRFARLLSSIYVGDSSKQSNREIG
jgi:hypothetical protein